MASAPSSSSATLRLCLEAASSGALVLSSNRRAARFLQREYGDWQRSSGAQGWPAPVILTWDNWLSNEWQRALLRHGNTPLLLSNAQEKTLWASTIAAQPEASPLNVDALADLAQQAWKLLFDHGGSAASLNAASLTRVDWQRYSKWSAQFSSSLRRNNWLTRAELPSYLLQQLQSGDWVPAKPILLWGFDRLNLAQQRLVEALRTFSQVDEITLAADPCAAGGRVAVARVPMPEDEFRAAAQWARLRLQSNPDARLAILTTKASDERGALARALSQQLESKQFSFSLGHPLAHASMVKVALQLLRWPSQALPAAEIADVLLSRELCRSDLENRQRAEFETAQFRRRNSAEPAMDLAAFTGWLHRQLQRSPSATMERLLRQCEAALEVQRNNTSRISAEKWAEHFRNTLAAFEFPAEFGGSHQFQTFDRWQQLLDEFATLSLSGERYSVRDALQRLSGMAAEAIFQPESTDTPVTIMGPLEAAGSLFDGIFFLGCTDERWPIPQTINPLLPAALQQALHMPGAVRGESQEQGRQMTQRIVRSAGEVIFSHAQQNSDGEVRPSPILREIADISPAEILADLHRAADQPAFLLREYADETPSRWTAARGTVASGLLRSQAACPFQAFALHRLRARGEDIAEEGFDNLQRGQLLHKLLQEVWTGDGGLVTSAALHATIDNGTLEAFVREKAATVLRDASAGGWEREYLAIERERLSGLVCGWLHDVEARRSPFRVLETEREHTFALLDELNFKVRLDRVDEALDVSGEGTGETILLDYKSGKVNNKAWHVENNLHMDEPQMPLYALYALRDADGNITPPAALAFASLHSENGPCLQGVSARPGLLPPSKKDPANRDALDGLLEKWQQDIENVAWEFVTGDAQVKPKHGAKTCEHCDLQPLCRVHTQQALLEDADEAEDADGLAEAGAE